MTSKGRLEKPRAEIELPDDFRSKVVSNPVDEPDGAAEEPRAGWINVFTKDSQLVLLSTE